MPFDFIVGQTQLPAGDYVFTEQTDPAIVAIASADRRHFAFVLTFSDGSDAPVTQPELVFDRVGGQYFLARIAADDDNVRGIPVTAAMKARAVDRVAVALEGGSR